MKKYKYKLPPIEKDERIYFEVPYEINSLARSTHCCFDNEKKLWFTGCHNSNLQILINRFGINENTSEKAIKLLEQTLKEKKIGK